MVEKENQPVNVLIRSEDKDHPKLPKLARMVSVEAGLEPPRADAVWFAWGAGLTREWLFQKLEAKGQVLILPPWPRGGFAGLPPFRPVAAPNNRLELDNTIYHVAATQGIEETRDWKAEGRFSDSNAAWLVSYEPFPGAGKAYLCAAELLLANPNSRPKDVRGLVKALVQHLDANIAHEPLGIPNNENVKDEAIPKFTVEDAPYLLASSILDPPVTGDQMISTLKQRLMVEGNLEKAEALLADQKIGEWLSRPVNRRQELADAIDTLGFRSYRLELMETRQ